MENYFFLTVKRFFWFGIIVYFSILTDCGEIVEALERSSADGKEEIPFKSSLSPLQYGFSSFAVENPSEAANFMIKYFNATKLETDEFLVYRYLNQDIEFRKDEKKTDGTVVEGVRLPYILDSTSSNKIYYSDIYFIHESSEEEIKHEENNKDGFYHEIEQKKKNAKKNLTTTELNHYLSALHGELEEDTWNMYLDWHLAFSVSDVTPVFARLYLDNIPVVSRSESFFVEIPGEGIMIQILASTNNLVDLWTEPFLFCRYTTSEYIDDKKNKAAKIPLLIVDESELKKQSKLEIPSFVPSHHSYTTTIPAEQQKVLHSFTTSDIVEPSWETHLYSNGTCALLKWLAFNYTSSLFYYDNEEYAHYKTISTLQGKEKRGQLYYESNLDKYTIISSSREQTKLYRQEDTTDITSHYQIHFVDNFRKKTGELSVDDYQSMLENIHGDMSNWDSYFGNHLGFVVDTIKELDTYISLVQSLGIPYFDARKFYNENSIYVEIPGGILYQIVSLEN